jgi:3,4-dihydroxy 2-butanone 4-phosphate synthase/GTP cyclohydrolase II
MEILEDAAAFAARSAAHWQQTGRPYVTLTYAQSLDGAIASRPGHPLALSCRESQAMTHGLRASHQAILVGIGTVLADDPSLTVRLAAGPNPQPVILDSRLRFPPYAKLLRQGRQTPWIITAPQAPPERQQTLTALGARIYALPLGPNGGIDLAALLQKLGEMGVHSLMVEGGAQVITSFLGSRLVDQIIITIAPVLVGGVRVLDVRHLPHPNGLPRLTQVVYQQIGVDLVVRGRPAWQP